MNENEQTLLENLRGLAEDGPREAPAKVEERLMAEFRRRSRVRRIKTLAISGAAAAAAGIAVMLWVRPAPPKPVPPVMSRAVVPESPKTPVPVVTPEPPKAPRIQRAAIPSEQVAMSFYPLPEAYELPALENATVVRVALPRSSLRLIGFPVNEERAGERVQADVLVGHDGLARGVRFVQ